VYKTKYNNQILTTIKKQCFIIVDMLYYSRNMFITVEV